jgi:phosphate transport system protein
MRDVFHEQLDLLVDRLHEMARMTGDAMEKATASVSDVDLALADRVITEGSHVDTARAEAEERAYEILALQAPVATDLRVVVAAIHAVRELERMGDLSVHVGEAVRRRHPQPLVPAPLMPLPRIPLFLQARAEPDRAFRGAQTHRSDELSPGTSKTTP